MRCKGAIADTSHAQLAQQLGESVRVHRVGHDLLLFGGMALCDVSGRARRVGVRVVRVVCLCTRAVAAMWFSNPQGEPSGVCTGQRKPQDSGSSLRTAVVFISVKNCPRCTLQVTQRQG